MEDNPETAIIPGPQLGAFRFTGIWVPTTGSDFGPRTIFAFNGWNGGNTFLQLIYDSASSGATIVRMSGNFGGLPGFDISLGAFNGATLALDVSGKLSTLSGIPGTIGGIGFSNTPNADGWITVVVNGVTVASITNTTLWYGVNTPNGWGYIFILPHFSFGSFRVYKEGTPAPPLPPVPLSVPPSAATIPCAPVVQLQNGGRGKTGCNVGGFGWTPSFAGSPGAVPAHPDPISGELLEGKMFDLWVEVDVQS
jgi:hypothetical protein